MKRLTERGNGDASTPQRRRKVERGTFLSRRREAGANSAKPSGARRPDYGHRGGCPDVVRGTLALRARPSAQARSP